MYRVTPAREGLVLRHPVTREALPAEGIVFRDDDPQKSYWLRRQSDGDAVITTEEGEA